MEKEKNKVAFISVMAAVFLTGFKMVIGFITGSLGILSEALHSALDLVAAVITLLAVKMSCRPSDSDHHYGHGKIENLSALAETMLLFMTCFWIIYESVTRIGSGQGLHLTNVEAVAGMLVVSISILIDVWRSRRLFGVAKKYKSQALEADATHFSTDVWSSAVVLIGLVCVKAYEWTGLQVFFYADSIAALVVAVIVLRVCWQLSKSAVDALIDKAPKRESTDVYDMIRKFPGVTSCHSLRIRNSGHQLYIEATICVDRGLSLLEAHNITDLLELKITGYDQYAIVSIHVEPNEL